MGNAQLDMENAVDNAYNDFCYQNQITKIQADYMKETKARVTSQAFWNYVQDVGGPAFYKAVENALSR